MSIESRIYNSDLLKGTGLIQETLLLLDVYKEGVSKKDFIGLVIQSNVLVKSHKNRIKDIIKHVFYRRFFTNGEGTVLALKKMRAAHTPLETLSQLFLIYTCRRNLILFDFIVDIYQKAAKKNYEALPQDAVAIFIEESLKSGHMDGSWADSTKKKIKQHIHACLIDFKLTDKQKNLLPLYLSDTTANFLAHEMHFNNFSDEAIVNAEEWKLFGYSRYDTIRHLERLSFQGHYIFQNSGDIIKIAWIYNNMNEFTDAIG
jgi:hypothetical protein